jgi:hypothetical protein
MTAAARHCEARSAEAIQTFVRARYDSNFEIAGLAATANPESLIDIAARRIACLGTAC